MRKTRSRLSQWGLIVAICLGCTFGVRAAVTVTQCTTTNFTIKVEGFPNATIVAQVLLNPTGELILNTTYDFAAQTLVAIRPPTLAGGTYLVNFYANGSWITQARLNICGPTAGGGSQTNLYPAIFSAVCVSTNAGGLVYEKVTNLSLIRDCASEHGVTNIRNLRLVYNRADDSLQVVGSTNQFNTNQVLLCTVLSFDGGTSLTNTNHTIVERFNFVFLDTNTVSSGTFVGKERLGYNSTNQLKSFRLTGNLAYTVAASGTNSAEICRGVLLAGTPGFNGDDRDDDDDHDGHGDDDDQGHNGNGNHDDDDDD